MSLPSAPQRYCAIIPCFNEGHSIARIVRGAREHVDTVIVVDDASEDDTVEQAHSAGAIVVRHACNQGKGVALKTGFRFASSRGFAAAITLDGDGQHDTTEIPLFCEAFSAGGCDLVLGNRMNDTAPMPRVRRVTNRLTSWMISRMVGCSISDTQCGFRMISLQFWNATRLDSSRFDLESEILIKAVRAGARLKEVRVRTIYFGTGESKINPVTDTLRFVHLLWRCRVSS
ncbi:MAG TPA: glycosyltransferase family 2 protein [Planctomycetota bacterium]|nr:glycosyltransferase family 2 protein [Planctomycetota bacterium]